MTYEGRYVIIAVPEGWREGDPVPPASPSDLWFDKLPDFLAALKGPWDHQPIKRLPWGHADVPLAQQPVRPSKAV
jgi:hypothetical protein